jgi:glycerol-3-phosphate acyltransferase PlsX
MGGDHAPVSEVTGSIQATQTLDIRVLLVGQQDRLSAELKKHKGWDPDRIKIVHADEVITMEDSAAKAVRQKKNSSIRVAARLVRDGEAAGVVSAGNTGAAMATAKIVLGMIPGVERPALATFLPTITGRPAVMLDVGANVDSTPKMLAQFAIMGSIYSEGVFRTNRPKVGLLSIGEEEHKGNELTHAATPLFKTLSLNFIGNVEGRDLYTGKADVIVCDGFVGNVALKTSEGLVDVIRHMLSEALQKNATRKLGYLLSKGAYQEFRKRVDYAEYGGVPLLGIKGACIICHGRSDGKAIRNALRVGAETVMQNLNQKIESDLRGWSSSIREA